MKARTIAIIALTGMAALAAYPVAAQDEALYVAPTGNVGLGLNNPSRQLHLKGSNAVFRMDRTTDTAAFLLVRVDGGGSVLKSFFMGTNASGSNQGEFVVSDQGTATSGPGARRMTIENDGTVVFTGDVLANSFTPSSITLKQNVQPIADPVALTQQLQGVRFEWIDSGEPALGFIAEEVEKVLPEVVARDAKSGDVRAVNYSAVVPVLVEALKEQQRRIEELERQQAEVLATVGTLLEAQSSQILTASQ